MKKILLSLAAFAATTFAFAAEPAAPAAPKTPSEQALSDVMAVARERPVNHPKLLDLYLEYMRKFPNDERSLSRIASELPKLVRNPMPEEAAFVKEYHRRLAETIASSDYADKPRELLMTVDAMLALGMNGAGAPVDMDAARAKLAAFAARYPLATNRAPVEVAYAKLLGKTSPDAEQAYLRKLADSPNKQIADYVSGNLRVAESKTAALDMKFTAVDGREVDLAKLRGKVVLIDFWATWCGPCIAELPNVKNVYASYHAKGFEVIGVALDQMKDRQKLIDFTAKNEMPWPQYFDGKYWQTELAVKYSIQAIPAMFLLDQNGMVVSTNARGPKLESELKRLLKL